VRALLRVSEGAFWLLALVALAPTAACQWVVGKGVGSPAVFRKFLSDLWNSDRRG
jgi:hypothetical protein